jgi:hypothetical protein
MMSFKGEATNRDTKIHVDRYFWNRWIPRRRSNEWAAQLQHTVFPYFLSHIWEPLLLPVFPDSRQLHSRQLSLHLNNCRPHRSEASANFFAENSSIRVRHPPYSPDLTLSDFWFFGLMEAHWQDNSSPSQRIFSLAFRNF